MSTRTHEISTIPLKYPSLEPTFAAALPAFQALVAAVEGYATDLGRIARGDPGLVGAWPARFEQEWFPRLDAVAAYTLVREGRPGRILEIGCGHSSRFMAQAIADEALDTALTCVDPRPRAPLTGLPLRHEVRPFGDVDVEAAAEFLPGDILFVDSSHVIVPGNEVDRVLLDVLPRLPAGSLVHFHDIFLPDGYPAAWNGRRYNEQTAVGALLSGGNYEIVFASHYVATRTGLLAGTLIESLPLAPDVPEASLWLRKVDRHELPRREVEDGAEPQSLKASAERIGETAQEAARHAKGTHPGMMRFSDAELAAVVTLLRREVEADTTSRHEAEAGAR